MSRRKTVAGRSGKGVGRGRSLRVGEREFVDWIIWRLGRLTD